MLSSDPSKSVIARPTPPVIALETQTEPPHDGEGNGLPKPDAAAPKVVDQPLAREM